MSPFTCLFITCLFMYLLPSPPESVGHRTGLVAAWLFITFRFHSKLVPALINVGLTYVFIMGGVGAFLGGAMIESPHA